MSRIEELIKEKCPDGVVYRKISEICNISRGKVMSKDYIRENTGEYPVYSSQTENNGELGRISTYEYEGEYLTWTTDGANAGTVFHREGKFSVTNVCGLLKIRQKDVICKYLFYALSLEAPEHVNQGMGNAKLMSNIMADIEIPVPPVEVQSEIIRVLDKFTELEAGLQAELDARKKQYENYRDNLLEFPDDVERVRLGDICKIGDGLHSTPKYDDNGEYFFVNGNNLRNKTLVYDSKTKRVGRDEFEKYDLKLPVNTLLMSINGTIGRVSIYAGEEVILGKSIAYFSIIDNKKLDFNFLYYLLQTTYSADYYNKSLTGSSILNLGLAALRTYVVPLPPVQKQKEIVNLLQKFETLSNSLEEGLPAEIEARRKQYEYYRDKLLTFERKVV